MTECYSEGVVTLHGDIVKYDEPEELSQGRVLDYNGIKSKEWIPEKKENYCPAEPLMLKIYRYLDVAC